MDSLFLRPNDTVEFIAPASKFNPKILTEVAKFMQTWGLKDYWWKAKEDVKQFHALGLTTEWLDYFLSLKNQNYDSVKSISTDIFFANDPLNPKEALSDHQGILTSIIFKE